MRYLTQRGVPTIIGAAILAAMYSALSLSETDTVSALSFAEDHGTFHLILGPAYALLIIGILQLRDEIGDRMTRLARFANSLAIFGLGVGVLAAVIVPILEFGFGVETADGAIDAVIHTPEFMPMIVGTVLLGVAIAASKLLHRGYGALLSLGAVTMFVFGAGTTENLVQVVGAVMFGLGWTAIGLALRPQREMTATQPALVRQTALRS